jgi:hypothetical protein
MYIPDSYHRKNEHERKTDSRYIIPIVSIGKRIFNDQRNPPMEANLWIGIAYGIGIPSYLLGIVANLDNWKSNVLFIVAFIFSCLKVYFYFRKQKQTVRMREMELEERKRKMDDEIFS